MYPNSINLIVVAAGSYCFEIDDALQLYTPKNPFA